MTHVVAVGGSDAGIAAALRIRELDPSVEVTVVLADEFPNYSICGIPYWLGGDVPERSNLAHRTLADLEAAGLALRPQTIATDVDVPGRRIRVGNRDDSQVTDEIAYDELIIGTGAAPVVPPGVTLAPTAGVHRLHTMSDAQAVMDTLRNTNPRSAVIVGAGYIGLEMVEALHALGIETTIVQRGPQILPTLDPALANKLVAELEAHGTEVHTSLTVTGVEPNTGGRRWTLHADHTGGGSHPVALDADLVLFCTGVRPETTLAVSAGATLGIRGAISVDDRMRTGLPHVWAAGDCVVTHHQLLGTTWLPLGTTAHKQGRVAGENAIGGNRRFAGSLGTQVVKVFDLVAARTGLRDHETTELPAAFGLTSVRTAISTADDHKTYYPGATPLNIAVTGDDNSGRLLGAQIVGSRTAEVSKRIDTFATALHAGLTVDQVSDLDLSYTPPLGSPWDAVQVASQAWSRAARETFGP